MASAKSDTAVVSCPGCGARFAISLSMVGRRARCAACETPFIVPPPNEAQPAPPQPPPTPPAPKSDVPQHVGFECRVCGTRMYGRPDQVGKRVKCPDCGAITVIPPLPKAKPKNMPAALEGEQYELWDADTQPLPSEIAAAQPKYIAVTCRKCGTLMHGREKQVGQPITCPDCGTRQIVPPPAKPVARRSVLTPDSQTPVLDPTAHPGERPTIIPSSHKLFHEADQEAEYARAREKSDRTGKPMEIDGRGRPVLPRYPLLTGIWTFPFSAGCPQRWAILALGLLISAGLIVDGVPAWTNWQGDAEGAKAAYGGLMETIFGSIFGIIWLSAASNIFIAIVSQSAVGVKRISEWPSLNFVGSMAEMLPVIMAIVFTAAPGCMLGRLRGGDWWELGLFAGCSMLLGFPITLLSQLAGNSTWELIDLNVLGAAVRSPFSMLLFYFQSACLAAICVTSTVALTNVNAYLPLALAPLFVGCIIIYARLLGRLAWRLSEKMRVDAADEDEKNGNRATNASLPR